MAELREFAPAKERPGKERPAATSQATLAIAGMTCASCARRVEKGLAKLPGVAEVAVNLATERATIEYDPARASVDDLVAKVAATGYGATPLVEPSAAPA